MNSGTIKQISSSGVFNVIKIYSGISMQWHQCAMKRANEHNGASKQARLDVGRAADRIGDSVL